jgi:hypothetical protein
MDRLNADLDASLRSDALARLDERELERALETALAAAEGARDVADDLLPAIPIVRSLYALHKARRSLSDWLIVKKIGRFLTHLEATTPEEREAFLDRLDGDERDRILTNLLLVLDKHDRLEKAEIQAEVFKAWMRGFIDKDGYEALTHATTMLDIGLAAELRRMLEARRIRSNDSRSNDVAYAFASLRLLQIDFETTKYDDSNGPIFKATKLGIAYERILMNVDYSRNERARRKGPV